MKPETPDLITATKIFSATILAGVGAVGLYGEYYPDSARTRIAVALFALGLWLLVGAWTGRPIIERLRSFYLSTADIGVDTSSPKEKQT